MKKRSVYVMLLVCSIMLFTTCKKDKTIAEAPNVHIDNPIVRLIYFNITSFNGDPANAPNPHIVKEAVSADGINFGDSKAIFSYDNLVDPDFFKIGTGQYGLMVTDFTKNKLVLATSTTADGTFTTVGEINKTNASQSATIKYNGGLKTYTTGISVADLDITNKALNNTKFVVGLSQVNASAGICADPSVTKMADGRYIMIFKYAQIGSNPDTHQVWSIISSDPTNFPGKATLIRNQASVPTVVRVGSKLYLYYVDASANDSKIGVGISADNGSTWSFTQATLNGQVFISAVDPAAFPVDESNLN
jgi:hypothetical protein